MGSLWLPRGTRIAWVVTGRDLFLEPTASGFAPFPLGTDRSTRKHPSGAEAVQPRPRVEFIMIMSNLKKGLCSYISEGCRRFIAVDNSSRSNKRDRRSDYRRARPPSWARAFAGNPSRIAVRIGCTEIMRFRHSVQTHLPDAESVSCGAA
jgi:hypothetical protein